MGTTYTQDFYTWTKEQAQLLRARKFDQIDLDQIVEEIEDMGRSQYDQLESQFDLLIMHLLKWLFQPSYRTASWANTIREQRRKIPRHLRKHPGLKGELAGMIADAYDSARQCAADETGLPLSLFPEKCPWTYEQTLDSDFWPELGRPEIEQ
jgi:hypothetical protein